MILYSKNNDKIHCVKCNQPKFRSKHNYFDHISTTIDEVKTDFWFSVRNNAGNLYFRLKEQWYRTSMITNDGFDVYVWIYLKDGKLFTKAQQSEVLN